MVDQYNEFEGMTLEEMIVALTAWCVAQEQKHSNERTDYCIQSDDKSSYIVI